MCVYAYFNCKTCTLTIYSPLANTGNLSPAPTFRNTAVLIVFITFLLVLKRNSGVFCKQHKMLIFLKDTVILSEVGTAFLCILYVKLSL